MFRGSAFACAAACLPLLTGCFLQFLPPDDGELTLDEQVRAALDDAGITALEKPETDTAKVALGEALFFDKILSGNQNISCATCHSPLAFTGDALSVSIGQGGVGLGTTRVPPMDEANAPVLIPRNAPEVFNRGEMAVMFWDGRVAETADGGLMTPAGAALLPGLDHALAAQAMFPVTSRDEMRGMPGENDLADLADSDFAGMWTLLMERLLAIDEYRELFSAAFPDVADGEWTFAHAANAIAEEEIDRWTFDDAPIDVYLRGDDAAISEAAKRGALLFVNEAGCARCHNGPLLTDLQFHNRATPQCGPGKGDGEGGVWDFGLGRETGDEADRFKFRTPPLRNTTANGPWMHAGVFMTLEGAVQHCLDPIGSAAEYDEHQLADLMYPTHRPEQMATIIAAADPNETAAVTLTDDEFADLMAFVDALTSPSVFEIPLHNIPERVPSGLPVAD